MCSLLMLWKPWIFPSWISHMPPASIRSQPPSSSSFRLEGASWVIPTCWITHWFPKVLLCMSWARSALPLVLREALLVEGTGEASRATEEFLLQTTDEIYTAPDAWDWKRKKYWQSTLNTVLYTNRPNGGASSPSFFQVEGRLEHKWLIGDHCVLTFICEERSKKKSIWNVCYTIKSISFLFQWFLGVVGKNNVAFTVCHLKWFQLQFFCCWPLHCLHFRRFYTFIDYLIYYSNF